MGSHTLLPATLAALCLALAACGDDEKPGDRTGTTGAGSTATTGATGATTPRAPPARLSARGRRTLRAAQTAVARYCRKVGLAALRRARPPTPADLERVEKRLQALVRVGKSQPTALTPAQRTVREAIGDILEDVEGSNCPGPINQRLAEAVAALPAP
jgi:hypothetical protein